MGFCQTTNFDIFIEFHISLAALFTLELRMLAYSIRRRWPE